MQPRTASRPMVCTELSADAVI